MFGSVWEVQKPHSEPAIPDPCHYTGCLCLFSQNWPNPISPFQYQEEKSWRDTHSFVLKILTERDFVHLQDRDVEKQLNWLCVAQKQRTKIKRKLQQSSF